MSEQASEPVVKKSLKDRFKKKEKEETKTEIVEFNPTTTVAEDFVVSPFDENGNKQGKWLQTPYVFSEWYYDLNGNPLFIFPRFDGDTIGDLFDADSNFVTDLPTDNQGNLLPMILMTASGEYLEYFNPNNEMNFPSIPQNQNYYQDDVQIQNYGSNTVKQNNLVQTEKKEIKDKKPAPKQPPPPKIPKRLLKEQDSKTPATAVIPDYKHEKLITLKEAQEYEAKNFKEGQDMVKVDTDRESANIVFIGHVDAGKSTLSGRILKNTGEVDETEIRKFELEAKEKNRESWVLAYIMDINDEERTKGITVECGKAHFQLKNRRFVLLDAPGHKNYVPNMIAGACQADCAALIISARQGEFEAGFDGGQTQEHAFLAKALGVSHVICVVTKMDEVNWDQKRFNFIHDSVDAFLKGPVNIQSIEWVPINGYLNENIDTPISPERCSWYTGDTLFDKFNKVPIPPRNTDGPVRMPVLDKLRDQGLFLFGKLESGTIRDEMWVTLMPVKKQFQIQAIYNTKDQRILYASAGENVKIKPKGLDDKDLERGYMICSTEDLCPVTQLFIAELTLLKLPEHKPIMSQGYTCVLHMHTSVNEIEIEEVEAIMNPENKKLTKNTFLKSNQTGVVKIGIKTALCLEKFETLAQLGRFTIRDEEETIGFGQVKKIKPIKI